MTGALFPFPAARPGRGLQSACGSPSVRTTSRQPARAMEFPSIPPQNQHALAASSGRRTLGVSGGGGGGGGTQRAKARRPPSRQAAGHPWRAASTAPASAKHLASLSGARIASPIIRAQGKCVLIPARTIMHETRGTKNKPPHPRRQDQKERRQAWLLAALVSVIASLTTPTTIDVVMTQVAGVR